MSARPVLEQVLRDVDAGVQRPALGDNVDPERFPDGMRYVTPEQTERRKDHLIANADRWEWLADVLDERSRELLRALLGFHLLGHLHARIGPSFAEVRALLAEADDRLIIQRGVTPVGYAGSPATHLFDLTPVGYDIVLESYMLGVQGTFQLQQYRSPIHPEARPAPGDVAIDAGGCFGETALWLAHQVGPAGHVHTLELAPANVAILKRNLERNPRLASRITVTEAALWESSQARLGVGRGGPASMVTAEPSTRADASPVSAISLDELVVAAELDRVDFLKMDIEGAEPAALRGARATLKRWHPKLALAAYHDIDHLWQLPQSLAELDLGYRFALGHFTMHAEETVLYGWVR